MNLIGLCVVAALLVMQDAQEDVKLPSGKSQREEILKQDHQKNLEDAAKLKKLATELEEELQHHDHSVLSIDAVKRAEEIEKLAARLKKRLKR